MPLNQKSNIAASLGELVTVRIDPSWPFRSPWSAEAKAASGIGDVLKFTFLDLEQGLQESASPNYTDNEVVGRAEAYKTYVGTSNRELQVNFKFQAQGLDAPSANAASALGAAKAANASTQQLVELAKALDATERYETLARQVLFPVLWLESLKYPYIEQESQLSHAPPPVLLKIGSLFVGRCVLTAGDPQWMPPFDTDHLLPYMAEMQCTFTVVRASIGNYWSSPRDYR